MKIINRNMREFNSCKIMDKWFEVEDIKGDYAHELKIIFILHPLNFFYFYLS